MYKTSKKLLGALGAGALMMLAAPLFTSAARPAHTAQLNAHTRQVMASYYPYDNNDGYGYSNGYYGNGYGLGTSYYNPSLYIGYGNGYGITIF